MALKKLSSKQIPKVAERVSRISLFERSRPVIIHCYRTEGSFNWRLSEQWIRSCFTDLFLRRSDQNGLLFCPNVQPYVRREDMQLLCISKCYKAEWGVQALDPSNKVRSDARECNVTKKTVQTCLVVNISDSLRTKCDDRAEGFLERLFLNFESMGYELLSFFTIRACLTLVSTSICTWP